MDLLGSLERDEPPESTAATDGGPESTAGADGGPESTAGADGGPESTADRVAARLRRDIQRGRFTPGTRLIERSLAEEIGVSHIPVREALARLAEEGLVTRLPRRGARVAWLSPDQFAQVSDVRVLLERFVARRANERLTGGHRRELDSLVDEMVAAGRAGDVERVSELDQAFHERLFAIADHAILSELVVQLRGRVNAFLKAATSSLGGRRLVTHAESHRRLLDAIAEGPAARAEREAERHIRVAARRVLAGLPGGDE
jgi:DNA-binding GntR family transcriptional regulator